MKQGSRGSQSDHVKIPKQMKGSKQDEGGWLWQQMDIPPSSATDMLPEIGRSLDAWCLSFLKC